ncbi:MAG: murein hydrolase activator EnvC family protein [Actinomycetota bacterium]
MPGIMRGAATLATALALLAAFAPPTGAEPDPDRLEEIQQEIEAKEERLEEAEQQSQNIEEQLDAAEAQRRSLTAQIDLLTTDLQEAQAELARIQADLEATRVELRRWTTMLGRARTRLDARQAVLDERAATAYIAGPAVYLDVLLGADDLADLSDRATYLDNVLTVDSDALVGVQTARALVADRQTHIKGIEARLDHQWEQVHARTERIAAIREQQQSLLGQVDLEIAVQTDLLGGLEEARERYEAAIAALEAESARIRGVIQATGSAGTGQVGGALAWPSSGPIVSGFGWRTHPVYGSQRFHAGVDIDGACGQPIIAAESGSVLSAGSNGGYGLATVIDHGNGLSTLYGHQSQLGVSSGQSVSRGQQIGLVGTTGLSTGCHLHFEVRVNGEPVDPVPYLT